MEANQFIKRARFLTREWVKTGAFVSFPLSLLYGVSLVVIVFLIFSDGIAAPEFKTLNDFIETGLMSFLVLSVILFFGVLPAMIIGVFGGGLIGFILAIFNKKLSGFWSSTIGLITGFALIMSLWDLVISLLGWENISYSKFFFSLFKNFQISDLVSLMIYFPYVVPSIMVILISPYVAWKINNAHISEIIEK